MRTFSFLIFIFASNFFYFSCKTSSSRDGGDDGSDVRDIKMAFSLKQLPWKASLTEDQRKKAAADFELKFEATKKVAADKCVEVKEQTAKIDPAQSTVIIKGFKLTVNCEYKLKAKISTGSTIYFQTAEKSVEQKIPADGKIRGYQLCLVNAGDLFDVSNGNNCVAVPPVDGTDVEIQSEFEKGKKEFDPNSENAKNFRNFAKALLEIKDDDQSESEIEKLKGAFSDLKNIAGTGKIIRKNTKVAPEYWIEADANDGKTVMIMVTIDHPMTWDIKVRPIPEIEIGKRIIFEGRWSNITRLEDKLLISMNAVDFQEKK